MDNRIEKSLLLIAKSFQSELRLADLASEANLSEFHFHRLFKSETNQTPLEYLNTIKLEHAAHLLIMYPNSRKIEVAFECGFSSPAVFSRSFKEHYKISPSEYKKEKTSGKRKSVLKTTPENGVHLSLDGNKIPIEYLHQRKIQVHRVSLAGNSLNDAYQKLIRNNSVEQYVVGFYIDTPFHKKLEDCRHYIGLDSDVSVSKNAHFLEITSGYYTTVTVQGSFEEMEEQVVAFKENKLDRSGYVIKSLTAFERIKLPAQPSLFDYFSTPRKIFIQVRRK